jgi:hypothetical protein
LEMVRVSVAFHLPQPGWSSPTDHPSAQRRTSGLKDVRQTFMKE